MIAPIRDTPKPDGRRDAQHRKARRWIVESMLSRPDAKTRPEGDTAWKQWVCAAWIVLVAVVYLVEMLGDYMRRG